MLILVMVNLHGWWFLFVAHDKNLINYESIQLIQRIDILFSYKFSISRSINRDKVCRKKIIVIRMKVKLIIFGFGVFIELYDTFLCTNSHRSMQRHAGRRRTVRLLITNH